MQKIILGVIGILIIGGLIWYFTQDSQPVVESETPADEADIMDAEDTTITETTDEDADVVEITVRGENHRFSMDTITVKEGQTVRLTFVNDSGFHDFVIDEFEGAQTEQIQGGESQTIEFVADQKGTFFFYCSVGQHRVLGMEGEFIVE